MQIEEYGKTSGKCSVPWTTQVTHAYVVFEV